jgi:4-hydroxythreonine-4-phosphate dehydrogenase
MKEEKIIKKTIGISIGDINGIGPEVVLKSFDDTRILKYCTPIIFASKNTINFYRNILNIKHIPMQMLKNIGHPNPDKVNVYCNWDEEKEVLPGKATLESGQQALRSLETACKAIQNKQIDALVTAPINKKNIHSEDFPYFGHTEFLKKTFHADMHLMLMVCEDIKIGLQTIHIPLREVSSSITSKNIVEKLIIFSKSIERDFNIKMPKIAVLGLNPHAGDNGLIGDEEAQHIIPAIKEAQDMGIMAMGPYPADGFFGDQAQYKYDGILAMYHDQGLTPFKALAFKKGVNFTAGLPIVRTSPVHGTAFDIAGKEKADPGSFREAMYLAIKIIDNRKLYDEINSNPLKSKIVREKEEDN